MESAATELAPYALVRLAALRYPADRPAAAPLRAMLGDLADAHARIARAAPALADALHRSAADHDPHFHRAVVLGLRRDVHNGRPPRPAVLAALGTLPQRVPGLAAWLSWHRDLARLTARVTAATGQALTAEREQLAELCRADALRLAAPLTGHDLLYGIDRTAAAAGRPDARARKVEATVLRYALRAAAKTSPLSWYTHVGWGTWADTDDTDGGTPTSSAQPSRLLLARLTAALLSRSDLRERVPHRLAPGLREEAEKVRFRRDVIASGSTPELGVREEQVELAAGGPLRLVVETVRAAGPTGATPLDLARLLAQHLPGAAPEPAKAFLDRMISTGLLVPVCPVRPQRLDALPALADWLDRHDSGPAVSEALRAIAAETAGFTAVPAAERSAWLDALGTRWSAAGAHAGAGLAGVPPLTEDVILPRQLRLGPACGRDAASALPALAEFAELFDQALLVRRLLCDRFVHRFGEGGSADLAEFAGELAAAWKQVGQVGVDGSVAPGARIGPEVRELADVRAAVTAAVASDEPGRLAADVVADAARLRPGWLLGRPVSYSFFVQPVPPSGGLVLNHVYAGFGRFTSRFLDQLDPAARDAVTAQLHRVLPPATLAQFRPVAGFNANLHPLLAPHEVGEDAAWADLAAADLRVVHDPAADQLRIRHGDTGAHLDVLYLGLLAPFMLPDRVAALHGDLACGLVSLAHLAPAGTRAGAATTQRLRYEQLVLARRSWRLSADLLAELRTDLAGGGEVPAGAVASWRGRLGLPERVFVGPADPTVRSPQDFPRYTRQPKPQYVDLGSALHLRSLARLLARHDDGVLVTEALPVPGPANPGGRVTELIIETYRRAR